jgi:ABC-type antimicrobial peptide transport system permease subunit
MFAVAVLVAHKLRAGWRGWTGLALIIALSGGAVLAAAAGASRTNSAYPRFLSQSPASDVLVSPTNSGDLSYDDAVGTLAGAAASAPIAGINAVPVNAKGVPDNGVIMFVPPDGRYARTMDVPRMLAGRLPSQDAPREIAVDQIAAQRLRLHVGSVLRMAALNSSNHVRPLTEHVVGVYVTRGSVVPVTYLDQVPQIMGSLALFRELGPAYVGFDGVYVKLKPGASVAAFTAAAQQLARRYPATGKQVFVADEATQAATIERAIRPQAVALALFALALALTALLIIGQTAARTLLTATQDNGTLVALGMTRRQLFTASMTETAAATVAGALGAVVIAIAVSPLTPIGPARLAEPDPGISVNAGVLAAGAAAIVVLLAARVAVTAWRQAGARPDTDLAEPPSRLRPRLAERLSWAGVPLAAATGVRFALDPGTGRASVPVRSALLGLAIAVAAVAGAATFGANLLRLVGTPSLYGQAWDVAYDGQFDVITPKQFSQLTAHVAGITDVTFGVHGTVTIGKTVIPAIGLAPGTGPMMSSTVLAGRPPATAGEIALGASVLRDLGLRVGQTVPVSTPAGKRTMLITGSAVFPYFGQGSFTPTDAGQGAETTAAVLQPLANAANGVGYNFALVSFAPGPDRQAHLAAFTRAWQPVCAAIEQTTCLVTDQRPNTVNNYAAIDATPEILAGVLAVLGLAVLAQFILASAHRRRRDFALLKVLGMFRRELGAVALWQVTTVTAVALVVGVPLGIAGGRWAWQLFANQAGLPTDAITSLPVLWMIPATLLVAALVALPPARSVARVPAAATLRSE